MKWLLRDYQEEKAAEAVEFIRNGGTRRLYVSPCGTGKSLIELAVQERVPGSVILTPRQEIIDGMIEKGGDGERIYTPLMYRNRLLAGIIRRPTALIVDEAHHETAETAEQVRLCVGDTPTVAYTATPFRGTPQGTAALRALYGEPHYILTLADAVVRDLCQLPTCETKPILDDDIVEISNGEFRVSAVEGKTDWPMAADLLQELWKTPRPTVVCLSSVRALRVFAEALDGVGVPHCEVTAETGRDARQVGFAACSDARSVLLQINVVSEGVDLHVRNLVDLAPTTSPVKWLQQVGRAMRPGDRSRYVCCNRNLLRHGYLFEGLLPPDAFLGSQTAFPAAPKRGYARAFGLEGTGRLKPCVVPMANGLTASAYYVTRSEGHRSAEYVAIVLPHDPEVLWATRNNSWDGDGKRKYGHWARCDPPTDLKGFASAKANPIRPRQEAWWRRDAARHGLDPDAEIDAKTFAVLPVLAHTGKAVS